jgi:superfamily II DNA or RNA helicase
MDATFLSRTFLAYFDPRTLAKGRTVFRNSRVSSIQEAPGNRLQASVIGNKDYFTVLQLSDAKNEIKRTSCTCPMRFDCKHAAAVACSYFANGDVASGDIELSISMHGDGESIAASGAYELALVAPEFPLQRRAPLSDIGGKSTPMLPSPADDDVFGLALEPRSARRDAVEPDSVDDEEASSVVRTDSLATLKAAYKNLAHVLRPEEELVEPSEQQLARAAAHSREKSAVIYILNERVGSSRPFIEPRKVLVRGDGSLSTETIMRGEQLLESGFLRYLTDADRRIGKLWFATGSAGSRYDHLSEGFETEPHLFSAFMKTIIETGRCFFRSKDNPPLRLGKPLTGKVVWEEFEQHQRLALAGFDDADNRHVCVRWRFPWYIDLEQWLCGPILTDLSTSQIEAILAVAPVSKSEIPAIRDFFAEQGLDQILPSPKIRKKLEVRLVQPRYTVSVELFEHIDAEGLLGHGSFGEASHFRTLGVVTDMPPLSDEPTVDEDGNMVLEKYDPRPLQLSLIFERMGFREIQAAALGLGADPNAQGKRYFFPLVPANWIEFVTEHAPRLREQNWRIPNDLEDMFEFVDFSAADMVIGVEYEENWWFALTLTLEVDGQKFQLFPILRAALWFLPPSRAIDVASIERLNRNGKFIWTLPSGRVFCIPFERIRAILVLVHEMITYEPKAKKLRVSILDILDFIKAADLIDARWLGAEKMMVFVECLKQLKDLPKVTAPAGLKTILRPYQLDGLAWLQTIAKNGFGGILADDMGLGKTIQVLAHILLEKQKKRLKSPFLVICPTSVLPNWLSEAARFGPQLNVVRYNGPDRKLKWHDVEEADLVISTYSLVIRDIERLRKISWHGVALDESQTIKNPASSISKIIGSIPANHRICMTGTPIENNLMELWSQFRFLLPGLLGKETEFKQRFRTPIEEKGDLNAVSLLTKRIRPFVMRRTKNEVAAELPEKTLVLKTVELTGAQRDLYESVRLASTQKVRQEIADRGIKQGQLLILDALLKLRQVCCDPRLVRLDSAKKVENSDKRQVLSEQLTELVAEGRRVLVFSQFTKMLDLIAADLDAAGITFLRLQGDTRDRSVPINQFQRGEAPVFLISLKAGGTGLNLTAADTVIHYDPWWNPAVEEQATDRAHRIGQTKNVFVYKLIAKGTIEQRMIELQKRKKNLASAILDETGGHKASFTEAELEYLLAPIDD